MLLCRLTSRILGFGVGRLKRDAVGHRWSRQRRQTRANRTIRTSDRSSVCRRFRLAGNNARAFVARGSPYIRWNRETLDRSGRGTVESASMSLLTSSIESTRLTRWNFGLGALTLLGVFAIALALILPDSVTP